MKKFMMAAIAAATLATTANAQGNTPAPFCRDAHVASPTQGILALTMMRGNMDVCMTFDRSYCAAVEEDIKLMIEGGQMLCIEEWIGNRKSSTYNSASMQALGDATVAYGEQLIEYIRWKRASNQ